MPYNPQLYTNAINNLSLNFNNNVDNYNDKTNVDTNVDKNVDTTRNIVFPDGCKGYDSNNTDTTDCKNAINYQEIVINQYKNILKIIKNYLTSDFEILFRNVEQNDTNITEYSNENKQLKEDYLQLKRNVDGASGQYNDIQLRHNQLYYANILILSCIIGGTVFYSGTRKL